jgi:hypothetical protein
VRTKQMLPNHRVRAELSNPKDDRTVEVTWSTGSKGLRAGLEFGVFNEELSMKPEHVDMSRLESGAAPVLAAHDKESLDGVIGVVERAWLENGVGRALLRFSESDPVAVKTFKKIQERILRNVSVGYSVSEYTDRSQRGDKYPTMLATKWQPREISIVPIGFDALATTRSEDLTQNEVEIIGAAERTDMKTKEELEAEAAAQAVAQEATRAAADAAAKAAVIDTETLTREAAKAATVQERTRVSEITTAVRAAQLDDSVAADYITRGVSMIEAAKDIFKKLEEKAAQTPTRSTVKVEITRDEKETKKEALESFLLHRVNPVSHKLDEKARMFYGMSFIRMCEELVGRQPGQSEMQLATRALTTSDLPNILANVAEKSMRADYLMQTPSFKAWTKAGSLRNYKRANRLMLGDFPALEQVNEHGEFKQGSMSESKETIQLVRYGKAIVFTKEMIVNDDLSALSDFSSKSARASSQLESNLVYTSTLLANPTMGDGVALFHATHGNLAASGTAITIAAVGAGWQSIANQTSLDGQYIDLTPKYILVGTAKKVEAEQFLSQNMLATQNSNINPFAGKLTAIVDPRITGNQWYLSADPSQIDTIELAQLESEGGPLVTVEKSTNGNMKITCEHSVGAAALDFRGLYKNPGA